MKHDLRLAALVAALLPLVPLAGCERARPAAPEEVRPVRSLVVGATNGSVGARYAGTVQARIESKLGFQNGGKVVARLVDVGSIVKRGQLLMRLDPSQEALQTVAAGADVDAARHRVAKLQVDLQRTEQLHARQFASTAEVDQQRLQLAEAQSHLKSALAHQQIKVNQRGYTELRADRDGVVTAVSAEAGQVVSPGQAVVTVAVDGEREVLVSIPESRVDELRQAKSLQVTLWSQPGKSWRGTLRELAPATDSATRTYAARIAVAGADAALRLGMTATVHAADVEGASAIRVPLTAVLETDAGPRVWIVDTASSRVSARDVKLGSAQDSHVIVASGLAGGETVVTAGVHMLQPNQRVKLLAAPAPAASAASGALATQIAQGAPR